jgi:hypothetical protein
MTIPGGDECRALMRGFLAEKVLRLVVNGKVVGIGRGETGIWGLARGLEVVGDVHRVECVDLSSAVTGKGDVGWVEEVVERVAEGERGDDRKVEMRFGCGCSAWREGHGSFMIILASTSLVRVILCRSSSQPYASFEDSTFPQRETFVRDGPGQVLSEKEKLEMVVGDGMREVVHETVQRMRREDNGGIGLVMVRSVVLVGNRAGEVEGAVREMVGLYNAVFVGGVEGVYVVGDYGLCCDGAQERDCLLGC